MILFPAIDLLGGKVVRLARGRRDAVDVYSDDPLSVARSFAQAGARWIHVVDLSATFEEDEQACAANARAIAQICGVEGVRVDAGGGVRSLAAAERLMELGVERFSMGTALVRDAALAREVARRFGEHAVADVAAADGVVRVNGWREGAGIQADELVSSLAEMGFRHLVFTDVARDGMRSGIDAQAYRSIARTAGFPVVASGGIASLDDLRALAALGDDVIEGAITGRALYEGSMSIEEALACCASA